MLRIGVPVAVCLSLGAVLLASAGEALIPARAVHVAPVVFVRDAIAAATDAPGPSESEPAPGARSSRVVQAPGWLEAEPFAVACTGLADGVLEDVLVLEGQRVEQGQIVARLVARDAELSLARADADVLAAQADVGIAESDLAAATTDWERPVERERAVAVTTAALAETAAELAQLPSLIAAERAAMDRLSEEHNRAKEALASGAANQIEEIIARKRAEEQAGAVRAMELREGMLTAKRDRLAAEASAAEQGAELRVEETRALASARASVLRARAALAQAEAARDEARLRLDRMTIRAPISGFVQRRLKAPGDKVMLGMDDPASAQIAVLYDPNRLQVRVDVPLADAAAVFVGQVCEVVVDVLPDKVFTGEVVLMTNEADLQKNTLQVKVKVLDPDPLLRPEMLTRVKFLPGGAQSGRTGDAADDGAVVVLAAASIDQGATGSARVWVVRERRGLTGDARPVDVEVVSVADGWAHVRGDLRAGDLVTVGAEGLRSGQRVRITKDQKAGGAS
jgi:RND family efflux transporter MFP subunit